MGGSKIAEKDLNKIMDCIDFRDGEKFSFNTNSMTNIRIGIGIPTTVDIVTESGKKMTYNTEMDAYIKCEERQ